MVAAKGKAAFVSAVSDDAILDCHDNMGQPIPLFEPQTIEECLGAGGKDSTTIPVLFTKGQRKVSDGDNHDRCDQYLMHGFTNCVSVALLFFFKQNLSDFRNFVNLIQNTCPLTVYFSIQSALHHGKLINTIERFNKRFQHCTKGLFAEFGQNDWANIVVS